MQKRQLSHLIPTPSLPKGGSESLQERKGKKEKAGNLNALFKACIFIFYYSTFLVPYFYNAVKAAMSPKMMPGVLAMARGRSRFSLNSP